MSWSTIITKKGSIYRNIGKGKTQRFKRATGEMCRIQDLLCFVKFNNDEHLQQFLRAVQLRGVHGKVYVIDKTGKSYDSLIGVKEEVKLAILKDNKWVAFANVSKEPIIGYCTFDQVRFTEGGLSYREVHIGNDIIHIE